MLRSALCLLFINFVLAYVYHQNNLPLDGRIVGGRETRILYHPYQISLEYLNSHRCGGVIIARTWVLTTFGCVDGLAPSYLQIRAGSDYREIGGQVVKVNGVIPHTNYSSSTHDYDIALLHLAQPLNLSSTVEIARLPNNGNTSIEGYYGNVTGWGATEEGGSGSLTLQVIEIPIMGQSLCRDLYSGYVITDQMFCAGVYLGGKDACAGDGGSPFVNKSIVEGLVSWGIGCARPQLPGVYTRVGAHRDWITEQTGI